MTSDNVEMWRPAPGCVGIEVSNHGRVRNRWGRILRGEITEKGYHRVKVRVGGGGEYRHKRVHRLVLEAFVGPCPPGMIACHNDGNPKNNHVSNLRWGTNSSNMLDRVKHGTCFNSNKKQCPRGHDLVDGNLVLALWRRGRRSCLACDRARAYGRRRLWSVDSAEFQALSDSYFAALGLEAEGRVA